MKFMQRMLRVTRPFEAFEMREKRVHKILVGVLHELYAQQ